MATSDPTLARSASVPRWRRGILAADRGAAPGWFRAGMLFFPAWIVFAGYFDAWAHHHLVLTTIWTPQHAVVWAGLAGSAAFVSLSLYRMGGGIAGMLGAIPRGYGLAVAGFGLTLAGGAGDLLWHQLFGIDQGFGSVTSPTHVMTAAGLALMATGPLREALSGNARRASWAALVSATLVMAMVFFFDEATHPFLSQWASRTYPMTMQPEQAEQLGTVEIIIWSFVVVGFVLPLVLRFELPFGALTLLLGATGILTSLIVAPMPVMVVGVVGGLVADELLRALRPTRQRRLQVRIFCAAVPVAMTLTYFLILTQTGGIWWPANIWAGSVVAAGIVGVLVSLLVLPASQPAVAVS